MIALTPDFSAHAFNTRNRSFQFQRIDGLNLGDTNSSQYLFNIDFLDNFSHDGPSGARVWLVAGHGSCRVVENNEYHICLIVDCIYYAGDRGGENVESPTNAKQVVSGSTFSTPCAILSPAPMHRQVSTMSRGMAFPSV